jgi:hypothetical protein
MRTKLTAEEKLVRALAKKEELRIKRDQERQARQKMWEQERIAKREAFAAALSEEDRADLAIALAEPSTKVDATGYETITNEFLHSLKTQYNSWGTISPRQLELLLNGVRQKRELAAKAETWKVISEGDKLKVLCKVKKVETVFDQYGTSFKFRMESSYGRKFILKTGRQEWKTYAENSIQGNTWVMFDGKVKWVAPDAGGPVVLTSMGAKFGPMLK